MIRFIIRTQRVCRISGMDYTGMSTIEADCPELENLILKGGSGESGCEWHQVVGAEVIPLKPTNEKERL